MSEDEKFLREYEMLCQKYKRGLDGCGCCGSPFLEGENGYLEDICYDLKLEKVVINKRPVTIDEYFKVR